MGSVRVESWVERGQEFIKHFRIDWGDAQSDLDYRGGVLHGRHGDVHTIKFGNKHYRDCWRTLEQNGFSLAPTHRHSRSHRP